MADPPRGTNSDLARDHGSYQLIGMEAPLHQGFGFPFPNELDCFCSGVVTVRRPLDRKARNVGLGLHRRVIDATWRPDQDRCYQPQLSGLDHALD